MLFLLRKIPAYLIDKQNVIRQTLFTALFALVFINIYAPFDAEEWFDAGKLELFAYSSFYILAGMLVIAGSRLLLVRVNDKRNMNFLGYILWIMMEILLLALAYMIIEMFMLQNDVNRFELYIKLLLVTLFVLAIPYSISWLYYSWKDQRQKIEELSRQNSDDFVVRRMINFYDESRKLRFTLNSADVLYIESTDNYVTVLVDDNQRVKKMMLRNTMKRLEKELENTLISRCHRSYMVNYERVKMVRLTGTNLYIYLDTEDAMKLPVSRTYAEQVHEMINKLSIG